MLTTLLITNSNPIAMASNQRNSDGLQPNGDGLVGMTSNLVPSTILACEITLDQMYQCAPHQALAFDTTLSVADITGGAVQEA